MRIGGAKEGAFVLALLAVSSCAGIPGSTTDAGLVMSKMPQACYIRAPITGPVHAVSETGTIGGEPGSSIYSLIKLDGDEQRSLLCACNENYNMSLLKKDEAEKMIAGVANNGDWKVVRSWFDNQGDKKIFKFEGTFSNFRGEFAGKGSFVFQGKCVQGVGAWLRRGQEAKIDAFIASAYDMRTSRPLFAPAPSSTITTINPTPSTESRLATLKDLLDRKVITQQEHDERRRAILGSL